MSDSYPSDQLITPLMQEPATFELTEEGEPIYPIDSIREVTSYEEDTQETRLLKDFNVAKDEHSELRTRI